MVLFTFVLLFILALLLESTLTTVPLVLLALLCLAVARKKTWIFPLAFFSGILLDILLVRVVGLTSLFFLVYLFFVLLYDRKYEIRTLPFIMVSAFVGTLLYGVLFSLPMLFIQAIISSFVAGGVFMIFTRTTGVRDSKGFQRV